MDGADCFAFSCLGQEIDKVKLLLEHGARTTVKDADGFNPVERARLRGQQETEDFACTAEEDLPNIFKDGGEGDSERGRSPG
jgi:hypothetical protein